MTDPTPAEALKALREYGYAPGNYTCQCYPCDAQFYGVKDAKRCRDCANKARARAEAIATTLLPFALSPPDAGEVRTYREGVEMAAKVAASMFVPGAGFGSDQIRAGRKIAAAIRKLP